MKKLPAFLLAITAVLLAACTEKAAEPIRVGFIGGLSEKSKIADIGCGTGGQTMVLGASTSCEITGEDRWAGFID